MGYASRTEPLGKSCTPDSQNAVEQPYIMLEKPVYSYMLQKLCLLLLEGEEIIF
ncbi:unnamed protein product [Acanthoscelides obtectus]|uniref:Uncharacterized protein n=1 Tax=Acanthoscelides obtectus TaxID=200917 RepID=A0A9P0KHC6_ACAOB|nr:unnamed protein product [Acanthoscelides obtectus]CAK1669307.1 hypothetical protein AOBTE_LOCUS26948 [Acanthoscelides obtectus]